MVESRRNRSTTDAKNPVTFREAAAAVIAARKLKWKSAVHAHQWDQTLEAYVYPTLGAKLVSEIKLTDIEEVLRPIWTTKYETARSVRSRIAMVLDWAVAKEMREANPARELGALKTLLGDGSKPVKHHAALAHSATPAFMIELRKLDSVSASALEFTILTACRTTEVREMRWSEVDGDMWEIPAERMKAKKEHRVPLSPRAVAILERIKPLSPYWVFPSQAEIRAARSGLKGPCLSNMAMLQCLKGIPSDLTVHGFRSTFRDWAADCTDYPHEVVEAALAHVVSDEVVASYRRTTFIDKRRDLMNQWANYCDGIAPAPSSEGVEELLAKLKASGLSLDVIARALHSD